MTPGRHRRKTRGLDRTRQRCLASKEEHLNLTTTCEFDFQVPEVGCLAAADDLPRAAVELASAPTIIAFCSFVPVCLSPFLGIKNKVKRVQVGLFFQLKGTSWAAPANPCKSAK